LEQHFVRIETDEGLIGIAGPLPDMVAAFVASRLRPIMPGHGPIAYERLSGQMHRIMVHGRQGDAMLAISAIDCALCDLKGCWLGQPVFRLLGGPTRGRWRLQGTWLWLLRSGWISSTSMFKAEAFSLATVAFHSSERVTAATLCALSQMLVFVKVFFAGSNAT
jgi:hypothetical protein